MFFSTHNNDSFCLLDIFVLQWKELPEKALNAEAAQMIHTDWAPNFLMAEPKRYARHVIK